MAQGIRTINGYTNNYPTVTTLSGTAVGNTTYMLGNISSLSFTVPAYNPANGSCEIRICFTGAAVFSSAIDTSNFEVAYGFDDIETFYKGASYEISIVPLSSSIVRVLCRKNLKDYGGWNNFDHVELVPYARYVMSGDHATYVSNTTSCISLNYSSGNYCYGPYFYSLWLYNEQGAGFKSVTAYFYFRVVTKDNQQVILTDWLGGNGITDCSYTLSQVKVQYQNGSTGNTKVSLLNNTPHVYTAYASESITESLINTSASIGLPWQSSSPVDMPGAGIIFDTYRDIKSFAGGDVGFQTANNTAFASNITIDGTSYPVTWIQQGEL